MEEALYHPEYGYYCASRHPIGREGDFYTSSNLDPVFGKLLAREFARMAAELDVREKSFIVVELGAGDGRLARDILTERPFQYCILERSPAMRRRQEEALRGFNIEWIARLPEDLTGCVFSNEFFDALPVRRVVRRNGVLREIYVADDFSEVEMEPKPPIEVPIGEGQSTEVCLDARRWIHDIAAALRQGFHLTIDYGYTAPEYFAHPRGTLMCYRRHQAVENPYIRIGEQDITAHVNFSDLIEAGRAASLETVEFRTQMDFLVSRGILEEMQALAVSGQAADIQRLTAIKKLILPDAMGERFKVLVQRKL